MPNQKRRSSPQLCQVWLYISIIMFDPNESILSTLGAAEYYDEEAENRIGEAKEESCELSNGHEDAEETVEVRLCNAMLAEGYGQDLLKAAGAQQITEDTKMTTADTQQVTVDTSTVTPHVLTAWELAREASLPERKRMARRRQLGEKISRATQAKIPGFPGLDEPLPDGIWQGAGQARLIHNYPNHLSGPTLLRLVEECDWKICKIASAAGGGGKVSRGMLQKRLDRIRKLPAETEEY